MLRNLNPPSTNVFGHAFFAEIGPTPDAQLAYWPFELPICSCSGHLYAFGRSFLDFLD